MRTGLKRNNPCYCNSNLKYKNCHLNIEQGFEKTELGWVNKKDIKRTYKAYNLGQSIGGKNAV